ncbi:hypothetical protein Sinac_2968 [Singulisphaera acidiphila DSM 18658]|uniref:Uncharacterized protein n=1 Tax=Singulisphaera acidiphila (strain ATCC BAA-1392 / DSM 18658 / VKM B-2454 / MOB10) TaxID=886293 RepID=L0DDC0_SINAD|nr:hypothetical protein Sinac_2968 [Singulisphaera acidiphila DSM 18658]
MVGLAHPPPWGRNRSLIVHEIMTDSAKLASKEALLLENTLFEPFFLDLGTMQTRIFRIMDWLERIPSV